MPPWGSQLVVKQSCYVWHRVVHADPMSCGERADSRLFRHHEFVTPVLSLFITSQTQESEFQIYLFMFTGLLSRKQSNCLSLFGCFIVVVNNHAWSSGSHNCVPWGNDWTCESRMTAPHTVLTHFFHDSDSPTHNCHSQPIDNLVFVCLLNSLIAS